MKHTVYNDCLVAPYIDLHYSSPSSLIKKSSQQYHAATNPRVKICDGDFQRSFLVKSSSEPTSVTGFIMCNSSHKPSIIFLY